MDKIYRTCSYGFSYALWANSYTIAGVTKINTAWRLIILINEPAIYSGCVIVLLLQTSLQ